MRRLLPWLRWGSVALLSTLLLLDLLFPLPLPSRRDTSIVVSARDGSPLRAFADAHIPASARNATETAIVNIENRIKVREQRIPQIVAWLQNNGG